MQNNVIISINILAAMFIVASIVFIFIRYIKTRKTHHVLMALAFCLLFLSSGINILDYAGVSDNVESFEELIGILFLPILIFSIHTSIINTELYRRKLSEQKFKGIFNQTFSFIGLLSKDGNVLEANSTALKFSGLENEEVLNKRFDETKWWSHSDEEKEKIKKAISQAQKGETVRFETTHFDLNHNIHYVDFTLKPIFDGFGNIVYLIPEGRDITEIKLARLELEKHKNNLEDLVSERTEELVTANEEISAINDELSLKNNAFEKANIDLLKSKQELEDTLSKLHNAQAQLVESEKMASIGVLSAGIAHEINNPINFINSNLIGLKKVIVKLYQLMHEYDDLISKTGSELLNAQINEADDKFKKKENIEAVEVLVNHIQTGIDRTVEIVNSLKYFLHSDNSQMTKVNIHDIIGSVLTILHNEYKNHISIIEEFNLTEEVTCVPGKINQVIMNIISNAISAIEHEGEIKISTWSEKKQAFIAIANNGAEINKEFLTKIFDPFFSTKPVGQGTGLGLYISYNIIKEHMGNISVKSNADWTEFLIKIPINRSNGNS